VQLLWPFLFQARHQTLYPFQGIRGSTYGRATILTLREGPHRRLTVQHSWNGRTHFGTFQVWRECQAAEQFIYELFLRSPPSPTSLPLRWTDSGEGCRKSGAGAVAGRDPPAPSSHHPNPAWASWGNPQAPQIGSARSTEAGDIRSSVTISTASACVYETAVE